MIALLTDDYADTWQVITYGSDEELTEALLELSPGADLEPGTIVSAEDALDLLGVAVDTAPDLDSLTDEQWGAWVAAQLREHGGHWIMGSMVLIHRDADPGDGLTWPGGPIQVGALHGSRERSWRRVESWADVRAAVDEAWEEEVAALEAIRVEKLREEERWRPLAASMQAVRDAERALADARRARDEQVARMLAAGETLYRVAQRAGLSQPTVARVRDAMRGDE